MKSNSQLSTETEHWPQKNRPAETGRRSVLSEAASSARADDDCFRLCLGISFLAGFRRIGVLCGRSRDRFHIIRCRSRSSCRSTTTNGSTTTACDATAASSAGSCRLTAARPRRAASGNRSTTRNGPATRNGFTTRNCSTARGAARTLLLEAAKQSRVSRTDSTHNEGCGNHSCQNFDFHFQSP